MFIQCNLFRSCKLLFVGNSLNFLNNTRFAQTMTANSDFIFRQLFDRESCTYTYLLADSQSKEAIIIDPVLELAERDAQLIQQLNLKLLYCFNTHVHADHITGSGILKKIIQGCKSVISKASNASADILLEAGDSLRFGNHIIEARPTPGHTNGCMTYICREQKMAFTGDTLFIRGCGRTDFQEGSPTLLYKSVHAEIFTLPDDFKLYPGHDYKGFSVTTVAEEKKYNPRLTKTLDGFVEIMNNLNLAYPKKIDVAVPANLKCGIQD